ncbi:RNA methyltransferase [Spirulina sp. CS-785/01]|uniref:RNA methyltransferase n=1 Tax=Spirulina sp. CS-785/01 TaxID=3021716 RepID=UPI00232B2317|nr:RNA methyltransferase [Spirulina sp. CS-785/01]MDB9312742.1 RNA methyltransferase [Spirulina sp. CS-785/01]
MTKNTQQRTNNKEHTTNNKIRIILVEPAGPLNVGSVARILKNMGLSRLVVVNPQCDIGGPQARQMAVHGLDVLRSAEVVETLPEALQGCQKAIATTGRTRHPTIPLETPQEVLPWLFEDEQESALIFGREDSGLTNEELNYAQRCLTIPANPDYASLNLAQAVAVCVYELYQLSSHFSPMLPQEERQLATLDELEGYFQQLEGLLLKVGYLYPHTASSRMEKFRRLYKRGELSSEEVAMLRGILRQVSWAVDNG